MCDQATCPFPDGNSMSVLGVAGHVLTYPLCDAPWAACGHETRRSFLRPWGPFSPRIVHVVGRLRLAVCNPA